MAGLLRPTRTSPAQSYSEPLACGAVYSFLRLPEVFEAQESDMAAGSDLEIMIVAAREQAELMQNRDLVAKQWDLILDCFPCRIELRGPLQSVDLVQYKDSAGVVHQLEEGTDFIVDLERGLVMPPYQQSWPSFTPWPTSSVLIRFTSRPDPVSSQVKVGMLTLISDWFNNRLVFATGRAAIDSYPPRLKMLLSAGGKVAVP
jgi:uncharacterized phiE125 gp8 family phage protein